MQVGVSKNRDIRLIFCLMLQTIRDRTMDQTELPNANRNSYTICRMVPFPWPWLTTNPDIKVGMQIQDYILAELYNVTFGLWHVVCNGRDFNSSVIFLNRLYKLRDSDRDYNFGQKFEGFCEPCMQVKYNWMKMACWPISRFISTGNLAIANRSRVSCAHNNRGQSGHLW